MLAIVTRHKARRIVLDNKLGVFLHKFCTSKMRHDPEIARGIYHTFHMAPKAWNRLLKFVRSNCEAYGSKEC